MSHRQEGCRWLIQRERGIGIFLFCATTMPACYNSHKRQQLRELICNRRGTISLLSDKTVAENQERFDNYCPEVEVTS
jgi:hypothetical protein